MLYHNKIGLIFRKPLISLRDKLKQNKKKRKKFQNREKRNLNKINKPVN